ncbi:TetR family transcriptional regulator [Asanoa ishikariensis]|uniref:Transcriptional regulator, TetR family n=1 Tax=Asanoa ishikariensis TaxID=137265 RepID=A0A1H3RFA6_9ACTN|nr:TetR family transcriptional regulator [Asanoa ishikariensis]GIF67292.1 TetR family transcriptional regulator [Asanoa ishikariensis]SDZ23941.1 transcriptional regulator, TetR family [Asanoa ishikariensis]
MTDRSVPPPADAGGAAEQTGVGGAAGAEPVTARGEAAGAEPVTARGEQTRKLILDTALRLFRERGYAQTTMRAVAKEAGVAVGNAYYYFGSKEHLIQEFYAETLVEHRGRAARVLATETDFAERLRGVLHAGVDTMTPSHEFAATFFKTAAEPTSPLSPFSAESSPTREASIALFREALTGSTAKVDPELRDELPELLWLAYMGVILYWVYDRSADQTKTRALINGVVPLIDRLVGLSRLRVLRPVTRDVLGLIRTLRQ